MNRAHDTFGHPMVDVLEPVDDSNSIIARETRIKIASKAMKDKYCTEICTREYRPSIHYMIGGFNDREYWSWAILSDFQIHQDTFSWHAGEHDVSRIAPYLLQKELITISNCETIIGTDDFIKLNQFRYCTPFGDTKSASNYYSNLTLRYNSVIKGNIKYLEDTESPKLPISRRARPETNYGLKLQDSMPMFAYRPNDNPDCFAEAILTGVEAALKITLKNEFKDFSVSPRCFDHWVNHSVDELTVEDKSRVIQMAFKATSAHIVKNFAMPPLFYKLASQEYLQFISSGRISSELYRGVLEPETNYSERDGLIRSYGEYYFKSIGFDFKKEIIKCIPENICIDFKNIINQLALLRKVKRVRRIMRCQDQSIENRLSIAKKVIQSAHARCKQFGIRASKETFSKPAVEGWMALHGETLAEMILEFQLSSNSPFFHVDHIVPLAALPNDYISDISSPAWHPLNLAILSEEENTLKNSTFNGRIVRRATLDSDTMNKAVQALLSLYSPSA